MLELAQFKDGVRTSIANTGFDVARTKNGCLSNLFFTAEIT